MSVLEEARLIVRDPDHRLTDDDEKTLIAAAADLVAEATDVMLRLADGEPNTIADELDQVTADLRGALAGCTTTPPRFLTASDAWPTPVEDQHPAGSPPPPAGCALP